MDPNIKQINFTQLPLNELETYLRDFRQFLVPNNDKSQQQVETAIDNFLYLVYQINRNLLCSIMDFLLRKSDTKQDQIIISNVQQSKAFMFYFQLLNLIVINKDTAHQISFQSLNIDNLSQLLYFFIQTGNRLYAKTFKQLLIFYFNLLKRMNADFVNRNKDKVQTILEIFQYILEFYFKVHRKMQKQLQERFKQETQWVAMILEELLKIQWTAMSPKLSQSFIQNCFIRINKNTCPHNQETIRKAEFNLLHAIGNFLHLVIQNRITTQLVSGYECPIQDVKKMYSNSQSNKISNLKLKKQDVLFLCQLLIKYYSEQKHLFREMFINKNDSLQKGTKLHDGLVSTRAQSQNDYFQQLTQSVPQEQIQKITTGELILQTINLFNCILFLGGYSPKLQQLVFEKLFQNQTLPQFLELAYLIYNERRFLGKYSVKLNMVKPPDANLSKILNIDYQSYSIQERKSIFKLIALEIKCGQLSTLLRLLTNLIHINNEALSYFQNNIKYLHIIMSLTHQSEINLTMKNWAVLFIKNSCDSQKLRSQIQQVKIQMKVDQ